MKKVMVLLTVFALAAAVSTAYACGEKSGSKVDATKSKAEMTAASEATVVPAVVTFDKDVSVEKAGSACCAGRAGISKASADSHCGATKAAVKAEQAMVKKADARYYSCPASASCPTPCSKEGKSSAAKSSSASVKPDVESEKAISVSAEVSTEAGTMK
jgi:hypothetical protein